MLNLSILESMNKDNQIGIDLRLGVMGITNKIIIIFPGFYIVSFVVITHSFDLLQFSPLKNSIS